MKKSIGGKNYWVIDIQVLKKAIGKVVIANIIFWLGYLAGSMM